MESARSRMRPRSLRGTSRSVDEAHVRVHVGDARDHLFRELDLGAELGFDFVEREWGNGALG